MGRKGGEKGEEERRGEDGAGVGRRNKGEGEWMDGHQVGTELMKHSS